MPFELTEEQQEGRAIFESMCWTCHGSAGRGDGPSTQDGSSGVPPTFHTLDFARASTESLLRLFRSGVGGADPDHPHMATVAEMLEPEAFANALSFIPALVFPPEIPGSALAGKDIFDARCAGCHGSNGTGDGPDAATFTTITPANFTDDPLITNRDWAGVFRKISDGSGSAHSGAMPAWGVVLSEDEIWDVVAFVATFQEGVVRPPYWLD
jgi:cbb3-type cytochrome c oxidase subunit III